MERNVSRRRWLVCSTILSLGAACPVAFGQYAWTARTSTGSQDWYAMASSADGTKLVAVEYNDNVYTSADAGVSWTLRSGAGSRHWEHVASSADGTKLAAVVWDGFIYTSADSGATWIERTGAGERVWMGIASSSDGTKLAACGRGTYVYTSTDSGATWTQQNGSGTQDFMHIASSSDGTKLVAVEYTGLDQGYIYTSADSGVTWDERTTAGARNWMSVASSADGTKLIAGVCYGGYLYTSTDSGVNWTERTGAGSRDWRYLACTPDGSTILAAAPSTNPWLSTDSGASWTAQTSAGSRNWYSVAMSTDAAKLVAAVWGGYIYTGAMPSLATVTTTAASSITNTTASSGGNATDDGGATVTARGVCWRLTANPTTSDSKTTDGTGTGTFTSSLTGLTPATTYHIRAYATNSVGTAYGSDLSFTTAANTAPTVTTTAATSVTGTTASSGGNVTSDGGAAVTARGVCWSTLENPTIAGSKTTDGTGTGVFTSSITGLSANTTYHIRAYATNSVGTAYGSDLTFTTDTTPTVTTTAASNITGTTADSGGNVTADGGATVTARGVCWSTLANPTIAGSKTTDGTGTGVFTSNITGLTANTTYHIRAYATNSVGTAYGTDLTFTTDTTPTVTTTAASNIAGTTADSGGNVTADGGATVTARGVCWSTLANPTIANSKTTDGTGTGAFTSNMTGLTARTDYHVRAYATNSVGTAYGGDETFTTGMGAPTVNTAAVTDIEMDSIVCGGTVVSDGGDFAMARGVCWNTNGEPTIDDNKTTDGDGTGTFTSTITGLSPGTTYYVRAYATNTIGTSYGSEFSVITSTGGGGVVDGCPYDPDKASPGVCGCGVPDIDSDDDGTHDCHDGCPNDPDKADPGVCGCGVPDTDTDDDGTPDCQDDDTEDLDQEEPDTEDAEEPDVGTDGTDDASTNGDAEDADTNGNDGDGEDTDADEEAGDGIDVGTDGDADTDGTADGDAAPAETTVSADGTASLTHNGVSATVGGVDEGDSVVLETDNDGVTTLTVTNADGEEVVKVVAEGLGEGAAINVSIGESGEPVVTMTDAAGRTLTINTLHYPAGVQIRGGRDDQGHTVLSIVDESGTTRTLVMEAVGADGDILITVTYNAPGQEAGQSVPSDGSAEMTGDDQLADVDSVTIEAAGSLGPEGVTIILAYDIADTAGEDESALRLHRLSNDGSQYLPAGTNDVGDEPPTYTLGDYGVDTASKTVWAQTDELGTFAVLPTDEDDTDDTEATASRQQAPVCGVFGIVPLAGLLLAMGVWTLARHRAPTDV